MKMRHLEVIHAVMTYGGVVAAANELGVTQPAITRMIQSAEQELGLKLFEKIGRRLTPTEDAEHLLEEIDPVIASFRSVKEHIVDLREGRMGVLRIAASPGLAHTIVPETIKKVIAGRPGMKVSLDIRRRENVIQLVRANAAELGFGILPSDAPDIISTPVHSGRIICVSPPDHPLASKETLAFDDFTGHQLVMMTRGSPLAKLILAAFKEASQPLDWSIETPYTASACNLVKAGLGVALVDSYVVNQIEMSGLVVVPLEANIEVKAYYYRARHKPLTKLASLFVAALNNQG